ncbi:terminase large subunit domain-containing protein [Poseidonocella sp. HB161398]|uniref:terminase large subunit domain-containing protein n=1 Tax=Poseidonocella sp. HB161398 TaxID=2320855 RepID=UPI00148730E6|nr:terminase large subunit [Poseidonocella sp. HB161398]
MTVSGDVIRFIEGELKIPTGPKAGQPMKLAPYMKQFIRGSLKKGISISVLSVARGQAKSNMSAAIAVAELFGVFSDQPRREVLIAASKRDQAEVVWTYALDLIRSMPDEVQERITVRYSPKLEIELDGEHKIRAIAADGAGILGTSPTLVIMDERAAWAEPKGSRLESALLTGVIKRGGRTLIISTSASSDQHPFSLYLDEDAEGVYRQEHRAPAGCQPDDLDAIMAANPGAKYGIGPSLKDLQASARRAMKRGGATLTSFRLFHLNQRVTDVELEPLVSVDDWLAIETGDLPPREGEVVIGLDLGGSASMSAAAFYWPMTGRLEARGWFPSRPGLLDRGQHDGVGRRYMEMQREGTLSLLGDATVPIAPWIEEVIAHVADEAVAAVCFDTFKQSEICEGLAKVDVRARQVMRRFGPFDGGEDAERFRRAVWDQTLCCAPSVLMRSALSDAVCRRDAQLNPCLDKGRSLGRIDAVSAAVLAVGEGSRMLGRGPAKKVRMEWAS